MKKSAFLACCMSLLLSWTLVACDTTSDTVTEPSRDCLISTVTLGTIPRTIHMIGSQGQDSTYQVSVTGSLYPMYIDQVNNCIYNADSLPKGTNVEKVVFSTFTASGTATIKSLTTGRDTIFTETYSTDFSKERYLTVYSTDDSFKRTYRCEVRVHQEEPDSFDWQVKADGKVAALQGLQQIRALTQGTDLYVFGTQADGTAACIRTTTAAPDFAVATPLQGAAASINVKSIQLFNGQFYGIAGGKVLTAQEPTAAWQATNEGGQLLDALMGCATDSLYAVSAGAFYASADGANWTLSAMDEEAVPANSWAATCVPNRLNATIENMLIVAGGADGQPTVWTKPIDKNKNHTFNWYTLPQSEELKDYACPALQQYQLTTYDGMTVLVGMQDALTPAPLYLSQDNGRTWKADELKPLNLAGANDVAITTDANHYLWVITSGKAQVFKGRHNRLGWAPTQTNFLKAPHH